MDVDGGEAINGQETCGPGPASQIPAWSSPGGWRAYLKEKKTDSVWYHIMYTDALPSPLPISFAASPLHGVLTSRHASHSSSDVPSPHQM